MSMSKETQLFFSYKQSKKSIKMFKAFTKYSLKLTLWLTGSKPRRGHPQCWIHHLHRHSNRLLPTHLPQYPWFPHLPAQTRLQLRRKVGFDQRDCPGGPAGPREELRAAVLPPKQQRAAAFQLQLRAGCDGWRVPHGLPALSIRTDPHQDCQSSQHKQLQRSGAAAKSWTRDRLQGWRRNICKRQRSHTGQCQRLNSCKKSEKSENPGNKILNF